MGLGLNENLEPKLGWDLRWDWGRTEALGLKIGLGLKLGLGLNQGLKLGLTLR